MLSAASHSEGTAVKAGRVSTRQADTVDLIVSSEAHHANCDSRSAVRLVKYKDHHKITINFIESNLFDYLASLETEEVRLR